MPVKTKTILVHDAKGVVTYKAEQRVLAHGLYLAVVDSWDVVVPEGMRPAHFYITDMEKAEAWCREKAAAEGLEVTVL